MSQPMTRPTIREALAAEQPLVTPLAHDALSVRLIAADVIKWSWMERGESGRRGRVEQSAASARIIRWPPRGRTCSPNPRE